jgi:hypothetical protein
MPQNKKRKQIRLKSYDYSENGYYFVTICSNDIKPIFGEYKAPVEAGLASARMILAISQHHFEIITNVRKNASLPGRKEMRHITIIGHP